MTYLSLTFASLLAALATENQPDVQKMACQAKPTGIQQVELWNTKQQMRETGMLRMDRYERYLKEPKMTFSPQRHA
jgi:hypothetical protein